MSITAAPRFVVKWETYAVAGNPRINPGPNDRNATLCAGWASIPATSMEAARERWETLFPSDRIVSIT